MKAYNRDKRNHNNIYKQIPVLLQQNITSHLKVYTKTCYLKRLPTYQHVEDREPGKIYYYVPCYGYVCFEDLSSLRCNDYRSKFNLNRFIDSVLYPGKSQTIFIYWVIDGKRAEV